MSSGRVVSSSSSQSIPRGDERLEPNTWASNSFTRGHASTLLVTHHGPFKRHEVSRVAISPRLESLPLPSTHEANPTTSRRQTQVGVVDSQQQAVFRP